MNQFVTNTYFSGCNLGRIGKVLAAAADTRNYTIERIGKVVGADRNPTGFGINKELLCAGDLGPKNDQA
jgi:hypothetical protein